MTTRWWAGAVVAVVVGAPVVVVGALAATLALVATSGQGSLVGGAFRAGAVGARSGLVAVFGGGGERSRRLALGSMGGTASGSMR